MIPKATKTCRLTVVTCAGGGRRAADASFSEAEVLKDMRRILLVLFLLVATGDTYNSFADKRKRSDQEKKVRELNELSARFNKLASQPRLSAENEFLHAEVSRLMNRAREAPAGSFLIGRLFSAIDDLLDSGEDLSEAREEKKNGDDDARTKTARDLERTYFRIRQGDYFADQSKERNAGDYVNAARRLYQQARSAYDAREYRRARKLASASREVIEALENLAQAAVPVPEPPEL